MRDESASLIWYLIGVTHVTEAEVWLNPSVVTVQATRRRHASPAIFRDMWRSSGCPLNRERMWVIKWYTFRWSVEWENRVPAAPLAPLGCALELLNIVYRFQHIYVHVISILSLINFIFHYIKIGLYEYDTEYSNCSIYLYNLRSLNVSRFK